MSPQLPAGLARVAEVGYMNQVVCGESAGGKDGAPGEGDAAEGP